MLTCTSCGVENQLGRVFCSGCGAKLDLSNMTSESITESQQKSFISRFWWIIPVVIVVTAIILTVLAFWPKSTQLGEPGTRVDGRNVDRGLLSMERIRRGAAGGHSATAREINAYFKFFTPLKTTASVKIVSGGFKVRVVRRLAAVDLKLFQWTPNVSYDITCVPSGSTVHVTGASMGHLPAIGPLKKIVINGINKEMAKTQRWKGMANLSEVMVEDGKIVVKYEKK